MVNPVMAPTRPDPLMQAGAAAVAARLAGRPVYCLDRRTRIGRTTLTADQGSPWGELLVAAGWWRPAVLRVPVGLVRSETQHQVRLNLSRDEFRQLRAYVADSDLVAAVPDAMREFLPLRRHGIEYIEVSARDGHVSLDGHVATNRFRSIASELAAREPGVLSIRNRLITDNELASAVAMAFTAHASLQPSLVRVDARLGTVRLEGVLATKALVDLACSVARRTPGVLRVESHLAPHPTYDARL